MHRLNNLSSGVITQYVIAEELRTYYHAVAQDTIPEHIALLLRQLDAQTRCQAAD